MFDVCVCVFVNRAVCKQLIRATVTALLGKAPSLPHTSPYHTHTLSLSLTDCMFVCFLWVFGEGLLARSESAGGVPGFCLKGSLYLCAPHEAPYFTNNAFLIYSLNNVYVAEFFFYSPFQLFKITYFKKIITADSRV